MQGKQIRVLRHIPKGARFQTALSLSRVVPGCVQQPTSILSWRKLFSFASTALRVPRVATISKKSKMKILLTTAVKHQVEAFTEGLCPPYPTPEAACSQSSNQPKNLSEGHKLRKLVELKIADGDVTGAIRLLSSKATVAPFNAATAAALHEKHPMPPDDLQLPPAPDLSAPALEVSTATIEKSIRSFNPGSAAGPDKLSPQHLKELISRQNGESGALLLESLAALANVMLAGIVPAVIQTVLYGANLLALHKPGGGIRPIAVGNVLRRLVAKSVVFLMGNQIAFRLLPTQLVFGTPGGCEAAVHATRRCLSQASEVLPRVLLKVDYKNAFNTLRRDCLLRVVKEEFPQIYSFVWQLYSLPSKLFFGGTIITSATGVQQGDPLGPALFSMTTMALSHQLRSPLNIWYLDDGVLGGNSEEVFTDLNSIIQLSPSLGLELNFAKCELCFAGMSESSVESTL